MLNTNDKKYDVVIFGATGFTGKLVVEYFLSQYAENVQISWAMAGRNMEKLAQVRDELNAPADTPLIEANGDDPDSIAKLVAQTAVVLTTVGPYQIYGENLVSACASSGTGYVDLCGEPTWMHDMINKYQSQAEQSGAKIVFSCGFDSIPFDLGVFNLQQKAIAETGKPIEYVKGRVRKMQGTFSGGTAASLKATMKAAFADPDVMKVLRNPFSLALSSSPVEQPNGDKPYYDESLKSWVAPFIMAAINTRNVHRSNMLLGHQYGVINEGPPYAHTHTHMHTHSLHCTDGPSWLRCVHLVHSWISCLHGYDAWARHMHPNMSESSIKWMCHSFLVLKAHWYIARLAGSRQTTSVNRYIH